MRDQQEVNLVDACLLGDIDNAVGIPRPGKARVHQRGLAGGRNEQRGLAALHVDEVNVERFRLLRLRGHARRREHGT